MTARFSRQELQRIKNNLTTKIEHTKKKNTQKEILKINPKKVPGKKIKFNLKKKKKQKKNQTR